jgi:hypothetical protein
MIRGVRTDFPLGPQTRLKNYYENWNLAWIACGFLPFIIALIVSQTVSIPDPAVKTKVNIFVIVLGVISMGLSLVTTVLCVLSYIKKRNDHQLNSRRIAIRSFLTTYSYRTYPLDWN